MSNTKTLILSAAEVEPYVNPSLAIEAVNYVFTEQGRGMVDMPPKIHVDMSKIGHESWCNAMPAYIADQQVGGIKWVGGYGENYQQNLPYIRGVVLLTDPRNGQTLAVMDGRRISDLRTGASAAVFARHLAVKPLKGILVVGAGVQGQAAIDCLLLEYPDEPIMLFDLDFEKANQIKNTFDAKVRDRVVPVKDLATAASSAGLIVLLTTARKPFLQNEWVKPGATVLAMGTYQQAHGALTTSVDKIIPDNWAQAQGRGDIKPLFDAGELNASSCHAELHEVVQDPTRGRTSDTERIFGVPVGIGAHDVCLAKRVYDMAVKDNVGTWVDIQ